MVLHDLVNNKIRLEMDKTFGEMEGSASKKVVSTGEEKKEKEKKVNEKST